MRNTTSLRNLNAVLLLRPEVSLEKNLACAGLVDGVGTRLYPVLMTFVL